MRAKYHKDFEKAYAKLSDKNKRQVKLAIGEFLDDPFAAKLRNHALKGGFIPQRSISVGGDLRIHYLELEQEVVLLVMLGTHSQLYR
jgi:addiction module RelE/StbE family toxin